MILCFYLLLQTVIDTYKSEKQLEIMRNVFVFLFLWLSMTIQAQEISSQDSLNIPVILVDGVEVQSLDSISQDDVVEIKVFKDEEVKKSILSSCWGSCIYNNQVEEISYTCDTEI